jgi:hypothetical protein
MNPSSIFYMDTVTKLDERHRGAVIVAGSHGGEYAAYCAANAQVRAAIFNDAAVGKDNEGIYALRYFDGLGVPAATTSHMSCRIGDGADSYENGVISYVNDTAHALGCRVSQTARACAQLMCGASAFGYTVPHKQECRTVILGSPDAPLDVVVIDSLALLIPDDANSIMVAGSHGALLPMDDRIFLNGAARAALFCDGGFGKDRIGISRINKLDELSIAAAAVSVETARIGNGMSVLQQGVLSYVNKTAASYGASAGMDAQQYVSLLQRALGGPLQGLRA